MPKPPTPQALAELRRAIGAGRVLTGPALARAYDRDAYVLAHASAAAVVRPESLRDVVEICRWATRHDISLTPRGAGTGLSGGATPSPGATVILTSGMRRLLALAPDDGLAVVQPGMVNAHLDAMARPLGLAFAPDPSSQSTCTLGGNVAENAGGPHTLKHGMTVHHILAARVVRGDGEVLELGHPTGLGPGLDLTGAFTGSEGTLGFAAELTVRLVPRPEATHTVLAAFPSVEKAAVAVGKVLCAGLLPSALELVDQKVVGAVEDAFRVGLPRDAAALLLLELDGTRAEVAAAATPLGNLLAVAGASSVTAANDEAARERLWLARKKAVAALGRLAPAQIIQDGVIRPSLLPEALTRIDAIARRHRLTIANVFHAGDGNLHPVVLFDAERPEQVRAVEQAGLEILDVCLDLGGTLTGEHGIGLEKRQAMDTMFSPEELAWQDRFRRAWDPLGRWNPDKAIPIRRCPEERTR
ncbi:MAG: FAD-linked oxidase C-terminal domain-containing protein [Candidatus Sericytochromatia bacterium]|nr:FAD-linked oxidase C-terminal domain-containing protein [Candidatus Sericytochromatia bacterium]